MLPVPKFTRVVFLAIAGLTALGSVGQSQDSVDAARKVIARSNPTYPPLARTMHISGSVRLEAVVTPSGTVKAVEIKGGHPVLALAAQNAVKEWKYEVAPRETRETVEVKFSPQ